jgi:hypothetical protein
MRTFFIQGKTTWMVGLFSPFRLLLSGALAGGNAVDACIGNVARGVRLRVGSKNKKYHRPLYCRKALEKRQGPEQPIHALASFPVLCPL